MSQEKLRRLQAALKCRNSTFHCRSAEEKGITLMDDIGSDSKRDFAVIAFKIHKNRQNSPLIKLLLHLQRQ